MIPYGRQSISIEDIEEVINVLKSDFLTQGPRVEEFEESLVNYTKSKFGVATNSATSALHIACLALDLNKGDYLWTSANSFVASANCGLYCGANIDFVDIDTSTYNISVDHLESKLKKAQKENKLPKILIPVHFAGQSSQMDKIFELSKEYGFRIIEDASHAIGGNFLDSKVGNCQFSDITIFSFHPVKIITTGEGGMATTNSTDLYSKMKLLRSHGITRDNNEFINLSHGPWYYEQQDLGFNYRITDIQAALGISQLSRIDKNISKRHAIRKYYDENLKDIGITLPFQHKDSYSSMHLYPVLLNDEHIHNKKALFMELRNKGLGVNVHYIPIHLQPYFQKLGYKKGDYPKAEEYYQRSISIPMYHALSENELEKVTSIMIEVLT